MELSVKNDKLIGHFQAERDMVALRSENMEDPKVRTWSIEHPETMLYGYLDSFLEICENGKVEFDLTYNTIKNLGTGLALLYQVQKKSYDQLKNTDVIWRSMNTVAGSAPLPIWRRSRRAKHPSSRCGQMCCL